MTGEEMRAKGLAWGGDGVPTPITRQMVRQWCRQEGLPSHRMYGSPSNGQTWDAFVKERAAQEESKR